GSAGLQRRDHPRPAGLVRPRGLQRAGGSVVLRVHRPHRLLHLTGDETPLDPTDDRRPGGAHSHEPQVALSPSNLAKDQPLQSHGPGLPLRGRSQTWRCEPAHATRWLMPRDPWVLGADPASLRRRERPQGWLDQACSRTIAAAEPRWAPPRAAQLVESII